MSNKPVLFYSPNCSHSINLWKRLKENNMLDRIVKINVNKSTKVPNNIKRTPTLLVKNREPLIGQSIDFYLRNNTLESKPKTTNNTQQLSDSPNNTQNNIQDHVPNEMGSSWSDNYSFISNNNPINHSFEWLNQKNKIPISNNTNNLDKKNVIDSRLENLKKERDKQILHR